MKLRHPNDATLQRWLDGDGDTAADLHIGTCQRCAAHLEAMDSLDDSGIGDALAQVLAPPEDLTDRLTQGVAARLSSRQVMDVLVDLFGAGFETTRLLITEEPDDND